MKCDGYYVVGSQDLQRNYVRFFMSHDGWNYNSKFAKNYKFVLKVVVFRSELILTLYGA